MKHASICSLLTILVLALPLHAQQSVVVTGSVVDAESGQPIVGASVRVQAIGRRTFTASNGTFRLPLQPGEYTISASSIGYRESSQKVRTGGGPVTFRLTAAPVSLHDVTVSGDITPEEIVRRTIARKEENLKRLKTFQGLLYSKFILDVEGNAFGKIKDEDRNLIAETFSRNYYDAEKGPRIKIIQRRQTANLSAADNLFALGNFVSFYDESIQILNAKVLSPLSNDPFSRYNYTLLERTMLDSEVVYVIGVKPATRLLPAFEGTIKIVRGSYNLVEVDLAPSASTSITFVRNLRFQQKFERFPGDIWQPTYLKVTGDADVKIVQGIAEIQPKVLATSIFTEVKVNEPLPDSAFADQEIITALPTADSARPEFWDNNSLSELSPEEKEIYAKVDSLVTKADTTGERSGFRPGLYPVVEFNRASSIRFGGGIQPTFPGPARIDLQGSYSPGMKKLFGEAALHLDVIDNDEVSLGVGGRVFSRISTSTSDHSYPRELNSVTALVLHRDYYDYYREDGWSAGLDASYGRLFANATVGGSRDFSIPKITVGGLLFKENSFRDNPAIVDGSYQIARAMLGWGRPEAFLVISTDPRAGIDVAVHGLYGETQDKALTFRNAEGLVHLQMPTIPTGYAPMTLSLTISGGIASDATPIQYQFRLPTSNSIFGRSGTFVSAPVASIGGTRYGKIYAEHNFSDIVWRFFGLPTFEGRGIEFILAGGAAQYYQDASYGYLPTGKTWYTEAGFGLGKIPTFISNIFFLQFDARWGIGPLGAGKFGATIGLSSPF